MNTYAYNAMNAMNAMNATTTPTPINYTTHNNTNLGLRTGIVALSFFNISTPYLLSSDGYVLGKRGYKLKCVDGVVCFSVKDEDGLPQKVSKRLNNLVAEHFLPNPHNFPFLRHKDGDKDNCNVDNLEWTLVAGSTEDKVYCLMNTYGSIYFFKSLLDLKTKTGMQYADALKLLRGEILNAGDWVSPIRAKNLVGSYS